MKRSMFRVSRLLSAAAVALLASAQWAVGAGPAKEGSFRGMTCFTGPVHVTAEVKEHVGASYDLIGAQVRKDGELGYGSSKHCVGTTMMIGKESTERGSCVSTDPDGDQVFVLYSGHVHGGVEAGFWRAVAGSGKYEGIKARGTWSKAVRPVNAAGADAEQLCNNETGRWKLK